MKISVLIPAAGSSSRYKTKKSLFVSKLLEPLGEKSVLSHSLAAFGQIPSITEIVIATNPKHAKYFKLAAKESGICCHVKIVRGGKTRAESVFHALRKTSKESTHVLIHDGARPLLRPDWIKSLLRSLNGADGAVLGRMAVPTVKRLSVTGEIEETLDRKELFEAETPQFFKKDILHQAYHQLGKEALEATDDATLVEKIGGNVKAVLHEGSNFKITTQDDLALAQNLMTSSGNVRFGLGFDRHRLVKGRIFWLGGVKIPAPFGPLGHSDGDPLLHAVIDGMLGALGLGDIGDFFSDKNPRFKNIKSNLMLQKTKELIAKRGFKVAQVDATVFLESPKLGPHKKKIQKNLAKLLAIDVTKVGVKAKTAEGLGAEGAQEAVSTQALVVLTQGVVV